MMGIVVINHTSGKRSAIELWRKATDFMEAIQPKSNPLTWPILETDANGQWEQKLREILEQSKQLTVVGVGGDGTLSALAKVCQHFSKARVFPIPAGRGNDFVRGLFGFVGRDHEFLEWATQQKWSTQKIDLARINDRIFLNMASIGYGGHVVEKAQNRRALWSRTPAVYKIEGALSFLRWKSVFVKVKAEGKLFYKGPCFGLFIGNGVANGHGLHWTRHAKLNDGRLDLALFNKPRMIDFAQALSALKRREKPPFEMVEASGSQFEIEFREPVAFEVDGDYIANVAHYDLKCLNNALQIWAPRRG